VKRVGAIVAVLALTAGAAGAQGAGDAADASEVDRLLERLVHAVGSLRDYTCVFTKQERVDGELQPVDTIFVKQRREPRCIYMKWIDGPERGREAIHCPERYGAKLKVHEGSGVDSWMTLSLDPTGKIAMRGERHPITEAGILFTTEELSRHMVADRSRLRFERGARPGCLIATQAVPTGHYAHRTEICVDPQRSLPQSVQVWNERGELIERYLYSDYRMDVGLTDRDFDVGNPDYRF
jgi:Protein of unknown function (DUF1571)